MFPSLSKRKEDHGSIEEIGCRVPRILFWTVELQSRQRPRTSCQILPSFPSRQTPFLHRLPQGTSCVAKDSLRFQCTWCLPALETKYISLTSSFYMPPVESSLSSAFIQPSQVLPQCPSLCLFHLFLLWSSTSKRISDPKAQSREASGVCSIVTQFTEIDPGYLQRFSNRSSTSLNLLLRKIWRN